MGNSLPVFTEYQTGKKADQEIGDKSGGSVKYQMPRLCFAYPHLYQDTTNNASQCPGTVGPTGNHSQQEQSSHDQTQYPK